MDRLAFADSSQEYLDRCGLRTFAQFFEAQGLVVNKNNRRDVTKLTLAGPPAKIVFMKRFHRPHLKDAFAAFRRFGRPMSQAGVEWSNANHLLQNGIETYRPLCFGEQVMCGFEQRSFLITEQLESTCLMDLILDRWQDLDRSAQEGLVIEMANLACRIHALNISLPDLAVWHLFTPAATFGQRYEFSVIDLHRMMRNVRSTSCKIRDLGKLRWSMATRCFDDSLKDLLVSTYAAGTGTNPHSLARAVTAHVRRLDKIHSADRYYRHSA
ncbi:MAG TPA: lipopolysaccharide kinase InaA family protein [Sedimentisphaerales bacterium]|jgi:hypothetical protein|nr:lipopolysaccharide kinase InaA family protein [Sedimentisphaerales bacterium]HNU31635.1 lipopolysaccharide kinase InaA family protein [Sedimentisphaerales bacterium]